MLFCGGTHCDNFELVPAEVQELPCDDFVRSSDTILEYITDIEGNWEYFLRFVHKSKALFWDGEERGVMGPGILKLRSNGMLVFGGDAPDKGPGDIRIVKMLLELKRRYPLQVHIILGNRDLMKLRFPAELEAVEEPDQIWMPTWDPRAKTFDEFLEENEKKEKGKDTKLQRDRIGKLKWLLHCTMGCQDTTFATRKRELALLKGQASDKDVLESYLSSIDPKGKEPWMLDFMRAGKIGLVIGDMLFVHGGLNHQCLGVVPGRPDRLDNVHDWCDALNAWKDQELRDFCKNPYFYTNDQGVRTRGAERLIEYGTPGAGMQTVIYHNPFQDGNPQQRSAEVQEFLQKSGIERMISGHQPHGQTPTVVRHPSTNLLAITADTSRSDNRASKVFNPADNRGSVFSLVRLYNECVEIEGELADGRLHRCCVHRNPSKDSMPDALVGRQLNDGSWVKTIILPSDDDPSPSRASKLVQTALGKGFSVKVNDMREHTAALQLRDEFKTMDMLKVNLRDFQGSGTSSSIESSGTSPLEDCRDGDLTSSSMKERDFSLDRQAFYSQETYIFSLMGVLLDPKTDIGEKTAERVNHLIHRGKRIIFITNNSNYTRHGLMQDLEKKHRILLHQTELSHTLSGQKLEVEANGKGKGKGRGRGNAVDNQIVRQHVVTSANTCAWFLKQKGIQRPFVICSTTCLCEELDAFGITNYVATINKDGKPKQEFLEEITSKRVCDLVAKAPDVDAVVIGWDQHFTALKAAVATQYIKWSEENGKTLPVISCSMDRSGMLGTTDENFCKSQNFNCKKIRAMGNGSMTSSVMHCAGLLEVVDVGKPSLMLLEQLRRPKDEHGLGVDFSKTVVVGSTLNTDIELANGGGMKSLLVLSGVTSREEVMKEVNPMRIPTWVANNFGEV